MNVLFVCSQGRIRSRTAEVLSILGGVDARCCGTDDDALVTINNNLLRWADQVVCMERYHAKLVSEFMGSEGKEVCSLGIRDEYFPFDEELVWLLVGALRHKLPEVCEAIERGAIRRKLSE